MFKHSDSNSHFPVLRRRCRGCFPAFNGNQSFSLALWFGLAVCWLANSQGTVLAQPERDEITAPRPVATNDEQSQASRIPEEDPVTVGQAEQMSNVLLATWNFAGFLPISNVQDPVPEIATAEQIANQPAKPVGDLDDGPSELTLEIIAQRRVGIEARTDLEEEIKQQIIKHFDRAVELLNQAVESEKRRNQLRQERDNAPNNLTDIKASLEQPQPNTEPDVPPDATLTELEQLRLADDERLDEARKTLEQWETRAKNRAERRPQMATIIEGVRNQLAEVRQFVGANPPEGELAILTLARKTEQEAQAILLAAQLEQYRMEQSRYEALNDVFPLQRDLHTRNKNALEKRQERWREIMAQARLAETERQLKEAKRKLRETAPALKSLAARNSELTARRQEHQQRVAYWKQQLTQINETFSGIEQRFSAVVEKEKRIGRSTVIGLTLRNQRNYLPDERGYRRLHRTIEQELITLQTEQLQLEDERKELTDIESRLDVTLIEIEADQSDREELRNMARILLAAKREYLDGLLSDFDVALATLNETDFSCRRLGDKIREYESYIDERVLWIRSGPPIDATYPGRTLSCVDSFLSNPQWPKLLDFARTDLRQNSWLYVLMAMGVTIGLVLQWRLLLLVKKLNASIRSPLQSGISQALIALGLVLISATPWPVLLAFLSWRLGQCDLEIAIALRTAFLFTAIMLVFVSALRLMFTRSGVAEVLLEWPSSVVRILHRNLLLYTILGIPMWFLLAMANKLDEGISAETVGRVGLLGLCVLMIVIQRNMFCRGGAIEKILRSKTPPSTLQKFHWIWYPALILCPLCLAVLAVMGFIYTAEQLMIRLELTLGLLVILSIAYSLVNRWAMTARRQLALNQARARREAALAAEKSSEESRESVNMAEVQQLDLELIKQQVFRFTKGITLVLFLVGCWVIWSQVLPALQVFSKIELWTVVSNVSETIESDDGLFTRDVNRVMPVTLGHLLRALVVLAIAFTASRNLPGLLELSVLQKLPLNHGNRTTIKILSGYVFLLAGLIFASNTIGLRWNSIQWLAAGLTVGLGFGLQEIFANFVSGLIILFERPIRLGDVVTIDGVTGSVSRIQIRATTITDWDRKEFIVPNKEFVTGRLLNWTLSDNVNRIVINVGLAYGADVQKALELLVRIAEAHPVVLREPAPQAIFENFGDSTLNLGLRIYLPTLENRSRILTEINLEIDRRFKEANLELSYPQRDLHIRSVAPEILGLNTGTQAQSSSQNSQVPPNYSNPHESTQPDRDRKAA